METLSGSPPIFVVSRSSAFRLSLRSAVLRALVLCLAVFGVHDAWAHTMSLEQQADCRTKIEEIRWSHTLWPESNKRTKPLLSEVLSFDEIGAGVIDSVRMASALDHLYATRIGASQLQAELDRMAIATRAPDQLREIYDALGNDARAVAECLVRPRLAREYLRRAYAWDHKLHAATREQAQSSLAAGHLVPAAEPAEMVELIYVLADEDDDEVDAIESSSDRTAVLPQQEWTDRLVALELGGDDSRSSSVLSETEDAFVFEELVEQHDDSFTVRSHIWRKQPFDLWWQGESEKFPAKTTPADQTPLVLTEIVGETADLDVVKGGESLDTWRHEYYAPTALIAPTAIWTGEEMIVWGDLYLNRAYRYTPSTDSWSMASTVDAPAAHIAHSAVWTGSEMIVWGGYDSEPSTFNAGGRYNPMLDKWTPPSTLNAPAARDYHSAVWTGQEMIIWGGRGSINSLNSGGRYDPQTDSWTPTSQGPGVPTARERHAAVWTGDKMIIWSGLGSNTGGLYDPETDSWSATSMIGVPTHRSYPEAVWTGSEMIIWGGYPYMVSGGRYNPSTNTWLPTSTGANVPSARIRHTLVWTGEEMIVWGGEFDFDGLNSGARYNPVTDAWLPVPLAGAPKARREQVAVWTGEEMIVWGGESTVDYSNLATGGRYDPEINAWQPTSTGVYAPTPRYGHVSVWTGTEKIVWGGVADAWEEHAKGGRYDVITATWSPTSTVQAPSELSGVSPSAIWTGQEMIIWGGYGGFAPVNTGHRYRPMNDSWLPTAITAQTPSPRYWHTAIWTGGEMIVWGGGPSNEVVLNDGARYDPTTDSWNTISSASGILASRGLHTAIWTGDEMIVWGGVAGTGGKFDDGARYDPVNDSWAPTGIESATPSARGYHAAVWTGTEMLVWGGIDTADTNAGARYDPSADSWTAMPVNAGTPTPRNSFTTIWTGDEMIVWGGSSSNTAVTSGGRFNPSENTWRATRLENAPRPRARHSAVWTGTEMLVWGGTHRVSNDLSAYLPLPVPDVIFAHDFELPGDKL